jgi:hypothetical protein
MKIGQNFWISNFFIFFETVEYLSVTFFFFYVLGHCVSSDESGTISTNHATSSASSSSYSLYLSLSLSYSSTKIGQNFWIYNFFYFFETVEYLSMRYVCNFFFLLLSLSLSLSCSLYENRPNFQISGFPIFLFFFRNGSSCMDICCLYFFFLLNEVSRYTFFFIFRNGSCHRVSHRAHACFVCFALLIFWRALWLCTGYYWVLVYEHWVRVTGYWVLGTVHCGTVCDGCWVLV